MSPQQSPNGKKTICASQNTKNPNRAEIGSEKQRRKRLTSSKVLPSYCFLCFLLLLVVLIRSPTATGSASVFSSSRGSSSYSSTSSGSPSSLSGSRRRLGRWKREEIGSCRSGMGQDEVGLCSGVWLLTVPRRIRKIQRSRRGQAGGQNLGRTGGWTEPGGGLKFWQFIIRSGVKEICKMQS